MVQLLNIAGTGPIFGALMGAVFGPVVFLWIVFGSILGGAVHDYMSGMISSRHEGASIAELSGTYLGKVAKWVMRIFSVVLLVLCGTVFVTSPAGLLTWFAIVNDNGFQTIWRYFSWSNQTLAMIALWVGTAYLLKKGKYRFGSLLTAFPASFMTAVSLTYILMAKEGFMLDQTISYIAGVSAAVILFVIYLVALIRKK